MRKTLSNSHHCHTLTPPGILKVTISGPPGTGTTLLGARMLKVPHGSARQATYGHDVHALMCHLMRTARSLACMVQPVSGTPTPFNTPLLIHNCTVVVSDEELSWCEA